MNREAADNVGLLLVCGPQVLGVGHNARFFLSVISMDKPRNVPAALDRTPCYFEETQSAQQINTLSLGTDKKLSSEPVEVAVQEG